QASRVNRVKDASLDSAVWSETDANTHYLQTGVEPDGALHAPVLSRPSSACSHISLASSAEICQSVFSFDESPGRFAHGARWAPQPVVSPLASSSPVKDAILGLSSQIQGVSSTGKREDDPLLTPPALCASPDESGLGSLPGVLSPLEHTCFLHADRSCMRNDDPPPSPIDISPPSPPRVWPLWSPLLPPHTNLEAPPNRPAEVTGLGLSIEGAALLSSGCHPQSYRSITPTPSGSLSYKRAGSIEERSPIRSEPSPRVPPASQDQPLLGQPGSAASGHTPGEERECMKSGVPSDYDVPLPMSRCTSSASGSSRLSSHLQAQPSHRLSPQMPFYPSFTGDDNPPTAHLSTSGRHVPFGLPTPELSPMQAPAIIRSPSADPRSPISMLTRIPGSVMEFSRLHRFAHSQQGCGLFFRLKEHLFWSPYASHE
ncbi:hypothetical protein F5148DRAFT_1220294, partial [Russula earlei]